MVNYIRKPRFRITKKDHRFVGFKVGDIVFYQNGKKYRIVEIDDCWTWATKNEDSKKKNYPRYLWTVPLRIEKVGMRHSRTYSNVMVYNSKLWESGHIGHSISYDECFHTRGEYLHWYMSKRS